MAGITDHSESTLQYRPISGTYDEMCTETGELREHWNYLIRSFRAIGPHSLEKRKQEAIRLLRDDGATYNVYGDPGGLNRPWGLDPVPLLIDSEEWSRIESGLIERADLMNLVLEDIYGPRTLIKKGLLPPEVILSHRGFLRACDGIARPELSSLVIYAVDLARTADGQTWVLSDRTQAPSGAGYALENRTIMSRIFPSLFRESHPHRLAFFFRALRNRLTDIAPPGRDEPRIVVLTPGPLNETYFEHVYLSSYLGYTLVEGTDLTVRDGRVWLKSLYGLEPVDVILRRVDDDYCDPLELRPDSHLGVAGLVEMARRGAVTIANPLGSSVLENPALVAFLPNIARHFLGHDLQLPSVATWWCGQDKERDYVFTNLHRLVIRSVNSRGSSRKIFGAELSQGEMEALRARIRARPHLYVGQEQLNLSSSPVSVNGSLQPRRTIIRTYLTARADSYIVMPGGLTRVAAGPERVEVSNQVGAISKDTWVLASEPERKESLWVKVHTRHPDTHLHESLSSRAAENLFWLARYAERAEETIRLMRNVFTRINELIQFNDAALQQCAHALLRALTHMTTSYPGFVGADAAERLARPEQEIFDIILNGNRVGTLNTNLHALLSASYAIRDLVSTDTWRVISDIGDALARLPQNIPSELDLAAIQDSLDQIITALMAFTGLTTEGMSRDLGWHFLDIGRRIERALLLISLQRATLVPVNSSETENLLLESVLATGESLALYRRRYRSRLQVETVLDLLILDENNPRSILYQICRVHQRVSELPGQDKRPLSRESRAILEALTLLKLADTDVLARIENGSGLRQHLDQNLSKLSTLLSETSDALTHAYFAHAQGPYQLVNTQTEPEV